METQQSYRSHAQKLMSIGLPLAGSNLAHIAIGVTDTVMLGWYSVEALAALVIGHTLFFVFFIVCGGFGYAVMPLVAQHAEAGETKELRRVTRMGLWLSFVLGMIFGLLLLANEPILILLGQDEALFPYVAQYMSFVAWAITPALLVNVLRSYLSALERTQIVLWVTVVTSIINAFLNWVLIFGNVGAPEMGIAGAGLASLSMHIAMLAILIFYVRSKEPAHAIFERIWRLDFFALMRVIKLGWPISLTNLAEVSLFACSATLMGWLGTIPLAAHGIALQLASITFVVHLGLSQAATVRVGRAVGRDDKIGLRIGGNVAMAMSFCLSCIAIFGFVVFPEFLSGLFIRPDEPNRDAIIKMAVILLMLAALFQMFDGLQVIALGLLRGMQDTAWPMVYAVFSYWVVGIPLSYILGFTYDYGGAGVWIGLAAGLAVASILLIARYQRRTRT